MLRPPGFGRITKAKCQEARTPARVTLEARWKAPSVYSLFCGYYTGARPTARLDSRQPFST